MVKFASASCVAFHNGTPVSLHLDDPWAADDPFVCARPDLFADQPRKLNRTTAVAAAPPVVEAATAAPGDRRTARRG